MNRLLVAAAVAVVVAATLVAVVLTRPGCSLEDTLDVAPSATVSAAGSAPDLSSWELYPGPAFGVPRVHQVLSAADIDVIVSVRDGGGALVSGHPRGDPRPRWSVAVPGSGIRLALAGDRLAGATLHEGARVFGLDVRTGADRFCRSLGEVAVPGGFVAPGGWIPLAITGDAAVTAWTDDVDGPTVAAVGLRDGTPLWSVPGGGGALHGMDGGVLTGAGVFHRAADGAPAPGTGGERVVTAAGRTALVERDDELVALDAPTGTPRWAVPLRGRGELPGTVSAGDVVVTNDYADDDGRDSLRGIDLHTGRILWEGAAGSVAGRAQQILVADGGTVWAAGRHELVRLDSRTGSGTPVRTGVPGLRELAVAPDGRVLLRLGDDLIGYTTR
ncbi:MULTISPECIES: outer membrane protein assembly factor BamB family protein [Pseudonocardia]|uniref:Pyrrolo-quinoline quinone repeat domain-containing protein n=2 Tax=Pseudonocardia TaxID=1847 RepID=A0A1Y2MUU1_PSEAH|nr:MULTISPECIES: PQQ-binding-like beta-propeller repeat protein [Pseudonocardia]OSY38921.1 hypothetical protein BG845_03793 [Pseudonocardia autotrophica]TDN76177.1 putative pyrroloquinoline-quinone binding quinoprotein [Pseudonocardia autotrophica]BBG00158.1 hypothetical protein Pdca_13670 [Pseudonocardia autotrophica]GEC26773.1 hypothetical protein PSA01_38020 [Pseudonocardia saturnea]